MLFDKGKKQISGWKNDGILLIRYFPDSSSVKKVFQREDKYSRRETGIVFWFASEKLQHLEDDGVDIVSEDGK